jgi:hypothetical protein
MDFWRSSIWRLIGGKTYRIRRKTRIAKVTISQKIRLVFTMSKTPGGPNCAKANHKLPLAEDEGDEQGKHDAVEGERLDEPDAEEHQRPGLLEGFGGGECWLWSAR